MVLCILLGFWYEVKSIFYDGAWDDAVFRGGVVEFFESDANGVFFLSGEWFFVCIDEVLNGGW